MNENVWHYYSLWELCNQSNFTANEKIIMWKNSLQLVILKVTKLWHCYQLTQISNAITDRYIWHWAGYFCRYSPKSIHCWLQLWQFMLYIMMWGTLVDPVLKRKCIMIGLEHAILIVSQIGQGQTDPIWTLNKINLLQTKPLYLVLKSIETTLLPTNHHHHLILM